MRSGAGYHGGIKEVAGNVSGRWYFPPTDSNESGKGKGGRNRVRTSRHDLVDVVQQYLECGTATHEGKGGCLIMLDEYQYGNYRDSEKRLLLLEPDLARYLLHLSSSNYKGGRGAQG